MQRDAVLLDGRLVSAAENRRSAVRRGLHVPRQLPRLGARGPTNLRLVAAEQRFYRNRATCMGLDYVRLDRFCGLLLQQKRSLEVKFSLDLPIAEICYHIQHTACIRRRHIGRVCFRKNQSDDVILGLDAFTRAISMQCIDR